MASTLSRMEFETVLSDRRGPLATLVGRDPTPSGSNAVYNDAAREALGAVGVMPASWVTVDADFNLVNTTDFGQLFDVGEYRFVRNGIAALNSPDQRASMGSQSFGAFRKDLLSEAQALLAQLQAQYGYGLASASSSTFNLNFEASWPCDEFADGCEGNWQ